jgi:hypothetical protein
VFSGATLPDWLIRGAILGGAISVALAGLFYALVRRFPSGSTDADDRLTGDSRRRAEIRQYFDAIGEPYAERHFVEGQHVAFFLPERDVAITVDPRAYSRIERSDTVPVLVEHELPGFQLGGRLPFETPEVSLDGGDRVDAREAAFAILGVPSGATLPEIKRAYREKVKEVHPDHGGDRETFRRVREAYTTAKRDAS